MKPFLLLVVVLTQCVSYALADRDGAANLALGTRDSIVRMPVDGGIREDVPARYRDRYARWKRELLSTEFGRRQWEAYAHNKNFLLTIKVSEARGKGAGTDRFLWTEDGAFVGATITLGADLAEGYPPPTYYPVLNSLSAETADHAVDGKILAATKLSHELGHVSQTAAGDVKLLQLQNRLMPVYISIFLKNGFNPKDKRLVDLAAQMGGTPIAIWEAREYASEVEAMQFLREKISSEQFYCRVFHRIKRNLIDYARQYERTFQNNPHFSSSPCWK